MLTHGTRVSQLVSPYLAELQILFNTTSLQSSLSFYLLLLSVQINQGEFFEMVLNDVSLVHVVLVHMVQFMPNGSRRIGVRINNCFMVGDILKLTYGSIKLVSNCPAQIRFLSCFS